MSYFNTEICAHAYITAFPVFLEIFLFEVHVHPFHVNKILSPQWKNNSKATQNWPAASSQAIFC